MALNQKSNEKGKDKEVLLEYDRAKFFNLEAKLRFHEECILSNNNTHLKGFLIK